MSIVTTFAAIAAALLATYGAGQFMSKSIRTEIEIEAPAAVVWAELTDGAAFADWNPFVRHLSGDLEPGATIDVTVQPEGRAPMEFRPTVLAASPAEELRWIGRLGVRGVFDGEHYFILEQTDRGTTLFRHGETFSGILTHVLYAMIGTDTEQGFHAMNAALKDRVEGRS